MPTATHEDTTSAPNRAENVVQLPRSLTFLERELVYAAWIDAIREQWEAYNASVLQSSASILPFVPRSAIAGAALEGGARP